MQGACLGPFLVSMTGCLRLGDLQRKEVDFGSWLYSREIQHLGRCTCGRPHPASIAGQKEVERKTGTVSEEERMGEWLIHVADNLSVHSFSLMTQTPATKTYQQIRLRAGSKAESGAP